ncbi:MAG: regulatory iron-sulfur-containing complex subunit RicT [Myxococcota bacterium]|nr:regulatory iron-sulfur-containing complex subunit RicT [Myxococcota bacterium]
MNPAPRQANTDARSPHGGKRRLHNVMLARMPMVRKPVEVDIGNLLLRANTAIIVKTKRGNVLAYTTGERYRRLLPRDSVPVIIRAASDRDLEIQTKNEEMEKDAFRVANELAHQQRLDIKCLAAQLMHDRKRLVLHFSAEERVDFRDFVKLFSARVKFRVEMLQLGVRQGCGLIGGIASCGQTLCCATFLDDFEPVAIKMVKTQNLPLNPKKVSGMCGRLLCCLAYEQQAYAAGKGSVPKRNAKMLSREGLVKVLGADPVSKEVTVLRADGSEDTLPLLELRPVPPELAEAANNVVRGMDGGEAIPNAFAASTPFRLTLLHGRSGHSAAQPNKRAAPGRGRDKRRSESNSKDDGAERSAEPPQGRGRRQESRRDGSSSPGRRDADSRGRETSRRSKGSEGDPNSTSPRTLPENEPRPQRSPQDGSEPRAQQRPGRSDGRPARSNAARPPRERAQGGATTAQGPSNEGGGQRAASKRRRRSRATGGEAAPADASAKHSPNSERAGDEPPNSPGPVNASAEATATPNLRRRRSRHRPRNPNTPSSSSEQ